MIDPTHDPRIALQVERYHTWPKLRRETNGEHSAQVARILLTVWPDCPRRVLVHCVTHDMGEMAGDVPYPFKRTTPGLKDAMDRAEDGVRAEQIRIWGGPAGALLPEDERLVFKVAELLDMWETGMQEQAMGNQLAALITARTIQAASAVMGDLGSPRWEPIKKNFQDYVKRRLKHHMMTGESE